MSRLSIVLPACNEEPMVEKTCRTLRELLGQAGIRYELVLVDDGSSDGTWAAIEKVSREDKNVTGVHFSRNFGKEAAIVAGLAQACGDAVAVMDCDLQHPPEILLEMYRLWKQGYEVVEGIKKNRGKKLFFTEKVPDFSIGSCPVPPALIWKTLPTSSCWTGKRWRVFSPCLSAACFSGRHHPG